jgi:hypothetical protein
MKYMVCHDGSVASELALDSIVGSFFLDKDKLGVASAWCQEKQEYLTLKFKIEYIKDICETRFLYLGNRFDFYKEEILDGHTAK